MIGTNMIKIMLDFIIFFFLLLFAFVIKILHSKLSLFRVQRSKRVMVTRMEHLPPESVSNILSRLPAKELLKCKCVCKSWFNLITDPYFSTNYYVFYNNHILSQSQEENLLVIHRPLIPRVKTYISLLSWNFNDHKKQFSSSILKFPDKYISDHKYNTEIMGPCNGIYFLQGNPYLMMNPSLKHFKVLPESHLTYSYDNYYLTYFSGFGFDPKTNDYKVVVLKDVWLNIKDERKKGYWTAELYSLNSNYWKKLDDKALPFPIEICDSSSRVYTYVNNCYHWWGFVDDEFDDRIEDVVLAFNMVNESFRKIKVPKIEYSNCSGNYVKTLVPFNEFDTIGVIVHPLNGKEKSFDIWIMKDYLDEGSWIKKYSFGPVPLISKFVGFYGINRFLWIDKNERLVLYDFEHENISDLQIYGKHEYSIRVVKYMESLVLLNEKGRSKDSNQ